MTEALYEIQVASMLGYRRWTEFRRAIKDGKVPYPNRIDGQVKIWSRQAVEAWIEGNQLDEPTSNELLNRIEAD